MNHRFLTNLKKIIINVNFTLKKIMAGAIQGVMPV